MCTAKARVKNGWERVYRKEKTGGGWGRRGKKIELKIKELKRNLAKANGKERKTKKGQPPKKRIKMDRNSVGIFRECFSLTDKSTLIEPPITLPSRNKCSTHSQ